MRTESELFALLDATLQQDPLIRLALLNGSRAIPHGSADLLSDYDVLLGVSDVAAFSSGEWLTRFGFIRLLQRPATEAGTDVWLVVFGDGLRVDFTLVPVEQVAQAALSDSLTRVLMDKDGSLPPLPAASERGYWIPRPSEAEFAGALNEFWWVAVYVAKGLWRGQIPYARHAFEAIVRPELERVLAWLAADERGWRWNPGAFNKHLQEGLGDERWQRYLATLAGADLRDQWLALDVACALMLEAGGALAARLGYALNEQEAAGARALISAIRRAPKDAVSLDLPPE